MSRLRFLVVSFGLLALAGCIGGTRATTTARAADETLLVSTAAGRAVSAYPAKHLAGKRVWIDEGYFDSIDKNFVISALREHVSHAGGLLASEAKDAEFVLEVRNGTLGINDPSWLIGIPPLPLGYSGGAVITPEITFGFDPQVSWAKFQFWTYAAETGETVDLTETWGQAETGWFQSIKPGVIGAVREATDS